MNKTESILIRVTPEIIEELDELAATRQISRSAVIRNLLTNCKIGYSFLESEWKAQEPKMIELEGQLTAEVIENLPPEYTTPETALTLSRIMRKVAKTLSAEEDKKTKR